MINYMCAYVPRIHESARCYSKSCSLLCVVTIFTFQSRMCNVIVCNTNIYIYIYIYICIYIYTYTVSQKRHQILGHNFTNYYPIFEIFSLANSVVNLQQIRV